jgi:hypothetical protein
MADGIYLGVYRVKHIYILLSVPLCLGDYLVNMPSNVATFILLNYPVNLLESCVLYIGQAYRYPPDVAFYIFFQ